MCESALPMIKFAATALLVQSIFFIAQMVGIMKKRFKEITSKQIFNLREPYGRVNVDLQRLATLGGSTNDTGILNDPTGNRRLLPVFVQSVDHQQYNNVDKDLLFIQGYNLLKGGFETILEAKIR